MMINNGLMRHILRIFTISVFAVLAVSCFKEPKVQGYLGENIKLQGSDTLHVGIGAKETTAAAWLDNSTQPCHFKIENVRHKKTGKRHEGFFKAFPTLMWAAPYDYLTDKTKEQVMDKLSYIDMTPLMINETNGQLRTMESTAEIGIKEGDIFHVDVSVTNSKGTVFLEDYAILKFEQGSQALEYGYVITNLVSSICINDANGNPHYPYYDEIGDSKPNYDARRNLIYKDSKNNRDKSFEIRKISDEPAVGIKMIIKILDKDGNVFAPEDYASWSTSESYIDHSVGRENTADGMAVEFPTTPWPVNTGLYSYIRGAVSTEFDGSGGSSTLDMAALETDFKAGKIGSASMFEADDANYPNTKGWPDNDFADKSNWFVRFRSSVAFYEAGTYEMICKVPYTSVPK